MDAPEAGSWRELRKFAKDKETWRTRVRALRQAPVIHAKVAISAAVAKTKRKTRTVNTNPMATRRSKRLRGIPAEVATTTKMPQLQLQQAPARVTTTTNRRATTTTTRRARRKKERKKKPPEQQWTNNQRKAFAEAHYIAHHGTAADGTLFLQSKRAEHTPVEMRMQLEAMCNNAPDPPPIER